jgi:hypothetical protein
MNPKAMMRIGPTIAAFFTMSRAIIASGASSLN